MINREPTPSKRIQTKSIDIFPDKSQSIKNNSISESTQIVQYWGAPITVKKNDSSVNTINSKEEIYSLIPGENHVYLLTKKNNIYALGSNEFGQLGIEDFAKLNSLTLFTIKDKINLTKIFCGSDFTFGISNRNEVYSWGLNMKGQLGMGHSDNVSSPGKVKNLSQSAKGFIGSNKGFSECVLEMNEFVISISCGALHTLALTNTNRVFATGYGENYALGLGHSRSFSTFQEITYFRESAQKIEKILAGVSHSGCLINGQVLVWGTLGNSKFLIYKKPNTLVLAEEIVDFSLGDQLTVLLTSRGAVYTIGENTDKQLGMAGGSALQPTLVNLPVKIEHVNCGLNHVIVFAKSRAFGWGSNRQGQLVPHSTEQSFESPEELIWISDSIPMLVICGHNQTYLISKNLISVPDFKVNEESEKNLEMLKKEIESFKRKTNLLKLENEKLKGEIKDLYSTLSNMEKTEESIEQTEEGDILKKFKSELKKNRTVKPFFEIDYKELKINKKISEGAFGLIYKGRWRDSKVAVKMLKQEYMKEETIKDFLNECFAMEALRHPNIVLFMGACTKSPQNLALILEYCSGGTLWTLLQDTKINLPWLKRLDLALGIARGMSYLHGFTIPVLHRDLKSLNILLDENNQPKIADFGWTRLLAEKMTLKVGTFQWMAPEVISTKTYTEKADIFSFGIILWEISSREPPYKNLNGYQVSIEVVQNDLRPTISTDCPKPFAKLMQRCWARDPLMRPSFKEIISELKALKKKFNSK